MTDETVILAINAAIMGDLYAFEIDEYNWGEGVLQAITKRKEQLERIISCKSACLQQPCEGKLRVQRRKNTYQYFLRTDPKDTNGKYLTSDKQQIAAMIAQREYDERIVNVAKKELKLATDYVEMLRQGSVTEVYESLNPGKQVIVKPVFMTDEQFVASWRSEKYETKPISDDIEFYSNSGVRVRSKSELIIANTLEQQNIPYRYEYPVRLKTLGIVRPDFMCLNVRKRQEYIWEYFGMMDNMGYANKNVAKIGDYQQSGYYQGKNMIMTFETSQHAISSNLIKAIIEQYLR